MVVTRGGSWKTGGGREWRELRAKILERDQYRCRAHEDGWCEKVPHDRPHTCTGAAPLAGGEAHHTLGRGVTGDDPRYIVASCRACNIHIGDPTKTPDPVASPVSAWG